MPSYYRRRGINRYYRKRRRKKYYPRTAKRVAYKALYKVNRMYNSQERKFFDEVVNNQNVDWSGNLYTLNLVDQGQTDTSRIGDKLFNTYIKLNF